MKKFLLIGLSLTYANETTVLATLKKKFTEAEVVTLIHTYAKDLNFNSQFRMPYKKNIDSLITSINNLRFRIVQGTTALYHDSLVGKYYTSHNIQLIKKELLLRVTQSLKKFYETHTIIHVACDSTGISFIQNNTSLFSIPSVSSLPYWSCYQEKYF